MRLRRVMYVDTTYLMFALPGIALVMLANYAVKKTFKKYSRVYSKRGLTGAEVARMILDYNGLPHVKVEEVAGELTDHYEHDTRTIRLCADVYHSSSVAALGVAAHEAGHAIQCESDYTPAQIRNAIAPTANFGSKFSVPLFMFGLLLASISEKLIFISYVGIILFAVVAIFELVTLPSEFDANKRAVHQLEYFKLLDAKEIANTKKVLLAASLTGIANLAATLLQLTRFIILAGRKSKN